MHFLLRFNLDLNTMTEIQQGRRRKLAKIEEFTDLICQVISVVKDKTIDKELAAFLLAEIPAEGDLFKQLSDLCREGVKDGWLAQYGEGDLRYGRIIKPSAVTENFSVDVVLMKDVKGPYHIHPTGEIDMVIPLDGDAKFDGQGLGWKVYSVGSGHYPTVRGGEAIVLYLLPNGEIEFTKPAS